MSLTFDLNWSRQVTPGGAEGPALRGPGGPALGGPGGPASNGPRGPVSNGPGGPALGGPGGPALGGPDGLASDGPDGWKRCKSEDDGAGCVQRGLCASSRDGPGREGLGISPQAPLGMLTSTGRHNDRKPRNTTHALGDATLLSGRVIHTALIPCLAVYRNGSSALKRSTRDTYTGRHG